MMGQLQDVVCVCSPDPDEQNDRKIKLNINLAKQYECVACFEYNRSIAVCERLWKRVNAYRRHLLMQHNLIDFITWPDIYLACSNQFISDSTIYVLLFVYLCK